MDNTNDSGNVADSGQVASSTTDQVDQVTGSTQNEPEFIDLTDENRLIKIKGSDKPVKFGEHVRNFQSQWTKEAQKRAALERTLAEREAKLQQLEAAQRQAQQGQQQGDVYQALRQLPYLSGEDAVGVVQAIAGQIQERDKVLIQALNKIKSLEGVVKTINQSYVTNGFESKIDRWLTENGWPSDLKDLAKEVYLAYEGDDLDQEFPRIFSARVDQMRKAFEAERQAKIRASKPQPFVPGQGGKASPSKPLQFKADASAREIAEQMWPLFQEKET